MWPPRSQHTPKGDKKDSNSYKGDIILSVKKHIKKFKVGGVVQIFIVSTAIGVAIWKIVQDSSEYHLKSIQLNIPLLLLSFFIAYLGLFIAIFVWRQILAAFSITQSAHDDIRIYCYSALGAVLPGRIWTLFSRIAFYHNLNVKALPVTTATLVENIIIGISALGVYAISTIIYPQLSLLQRPEIGIVFTILVMIFIHPKVFNRLLSWIAKISKNETRSLHANYKTPSLVIWLALESLVICIGSVAIFILLNSLTTVSPRMFFAITASWAAGIAVGNLFFWLPGTPLLRDGVMIIALIPNLPLPIATLFVVMVRFWTIISLLSLAGMVWLILDRPHRKKYRNETD